MSVCPVCERDPDVHTTETVRGVRVRISGHVCYCLREHGLRVAVGICCGRYVGAKTLAEEDFHSGAPWSKPEDCTCHKEST